MNKYIKKIVVLLTVVCLVGEICPMETLSGSSEGLREGNLREVQRLVEVDRVSINKENALFSEKMLWSM